MKMQSVQIVKNSFHEALQQTVEEKILDDKFRFRTNCTDVMATG